MLAFISVLSISLYISEIYNKITIYGLFKKEVSCYKAEAGAVPTKEASIIIRFRGRREMGRAPCCDKANVKKGPWSPEEDSKLKEYIQKHGTGGNWIALPQKAGLRRCGKSCRLRWLNYLRPNIKHGEFSDEEDRIICSLYSNIGSRWSIIAAQLPGRTDNDIKNYWNTKLKKKLMAGFLPSSPHHRSKLPPYHESPPQNPPSSFPPSHYRDYCSSSSYYNPAPPLPNHISFTTTTGHLEPFSVPSSSCYASTTTASIVSHPFYQNQESSLVSHVISPMQCYNYPITTDRSLLMFGSEASCSSSDGSCSHGKQEEMMMGFQNFMYSSSNKSMLCNDGGEHVNQYWEPEKPISNGCFFQTQSGGSTTPLDYDLEVIKQLISSNSSSGYGFSVDDENKTEEKAMLY